MECGWSAGDKQSAKPEPLLALSASNQWLYSLACSVDGELLASGGACNELHVWHVPSLLASLSHPSAAAPPLDADADADVQKPAHLAMHTLEGVLCCSLWQSYNYSFEVNHVEECINVIY